MDFQELEIITAITLTYQSDIENWLFEDKGEILQEDFVIMVKRFYDVYSKDSSSILDDVNKRRISIDEVV